MQIKILWDNLNTIADGVRIYRSDTPFYSLGDAQLVDTLVGDAIEYVDYDIEPNKNYSYRFEVFKADLSQVSRLITISSNSYTGPGSQILVDGDYDRGCYGHVDDFIMGNDLVSLLGLGTSSNLNGYRWAKYAYKGKILYFPQTAISRSYSWSQLYSLGLVYGTDDEGPRDVNTLAPQIQDRRVVISGETYKVRLPTSMGLADYDVKEDPRSPANVINYYGSNSSLSYYHYPAGAWSKRKPGNEIVDLIEPSLGSGFFPINNPHPRFESISFGLASGNPTSQILTQDLYDESRCIVMGRYPYHGTVTRRPAVVFERNIIDITATNLEFRPILEWEPSRVVIPVI